MGVVSVRVNEMREEESEDDVLLLLFECHDGWGKIKSRDLCFDFKFYC